MRQEEALPCRHAGVPPPEIVDAVARVIRELSSDSAFLQSRGLTADEYISALPTAIETMRGRGSASNSARRDFLSGLLEMMVTRGLVAEVQKPKYGDNTVYRLVMPDHGDVAVIQKGCPDGKHSSETWEAPDWASETYLWWVCSKLQYNPGEHVAKGVTRLRRRVVKDGGDKLDGVVFHNDLCGTPERPCPKASRSIDLVGTKTPPPCLYLLPGRDISDGCEARATRRLTFPILLLRLFEIAPEGASDYLGRIEFLENGRRSGSKIVSRYGPARKLIYL